MREKEGKSEASEEHRGAFSFALSPAFSLHRQRAMFFLAFLLPGGFSISSALFSLQAEKEKRPFFSFFFLLSLSPRQRERKRTVAAPKKRRRASASLVVQPLAASARRRHTERAPRSVERGTERRLLVVVAGCVSSFCLSPPFRCRPARCGGALFSRCFFSQSTPPSRSVAHRENRVRLIQQVESELRLHVGGKKGGMKKASGRKERASTARKGSSSVVVEKNRRRRSRRCRPSKMKKRRRRNIINLRGKKNPPRSPDPFRRATHALSPKMSEEAVRTRRRRERKSPENHHLLACRRLRCCSFFFFFAAAAACLSLLSHQRTPPAPPAVGFS